MFELINDIPFVSLFLKFMIASTVLLGSVWILEKVKFLNTPDLAELAWKLAIAGTFIAILPISSLTSGTLTIESDRGAALIEGLNENRPFLETDLPVDAGEPNVQPGLLLEPKADFREQATAVQQALDAAEESLKNNGLKMDLKRELITENGVELGFGVANADKTEQALNTINDNNTAANTNEIQLTTPEFDSEGSNNKSLWYMAADLRTKDLAAIGWGALAFLATFALLISYHGAVRNLGSRVRVQSEDRANKLLRAICEKADIRHVPYLSRSSDIKSPVCLPRKEICLPDWAFDDMPEAEFKSLLAHELGHMVRRDPIMLMILQLLSRVFFFQPLFIIARKRLTDIAELAADEWAAKQAENSRAVANALFTCATKIHETRQVQWGLAMAGNKSILKQRVERLIDAQSVPFKTAGTFTKSIVGVGVIGLSLGLPSIEFAGAMNAEASLETEFAANHPHDLPKVAPLPRVTPMPSVAPAPRVAPSPNVAPMPDLQTVAPLATATATANAAAIATTVHPDGNFHFSNRHGSSGNMNWHQDDKSISVKWRGDFSLNDAEDYVVAEDDDGYLKLSADIDGDERSIRFDVEDGKITHKYRVDGDVKDLDADGRKWLKTAISLLVETGFDAENRVARLYKKGKAKAVFAAIDKFEGDYVRRIYLSHLIDQEKLSDKDITKVVDIVATFDSDYETRLTLSTLLSEEKVSNKVLPKVLTVAKGMDSDYEKRLLVSHYISELDLTDKTTGAVIAIAETIDSDYELRLLMGAALDDAKLNDKNVIRILDMVIKKMDSDYEKRLLLTQLSNEFDRSDAVVSKALDAAGTIDSDYEQRLLLSSLISHAELNEKNWLKAIGIAEDIDSDYEKKRVFSQMRGELPNNQKVQAAFDKATADMDQDFVENDWSIEIENGIVEGLNEAMAELEEEMREFEEEQAEMMEDLRESLEESGLADDEEFTQRIIIEKRRAIQEVLRDRGRMEREIERATNHALRQVTREMQRVQRQVDRTNGSIKRELAQAMKSLERTKEQLEHSLERKKVERKERAEREKEELKRLEEKADTNI